MQVPSPNFRPDPSRIQLFIGLFFFIILIAPFVFWIVYPSVIGFGDFTILEAALIIIIYTILLGGIATLNIIGGIKAYKKHKKFKIHHHRRR